MLHSECRLGHIAHRGPDSPLSWPICMQLSLCEVGATWALNLTTCKLHSRNACEVILPICKVEQLELHWLALWTYCQLERAWLRQKEAWLAIIYAGLSLQQGTWIKFVWEVQCYCTEILSDYICESRAPCLPHWWSPFLRNISLFLLLSLYCLFCTRWLPGM